MQRQSYVCIGRLLKPVGTGGELKTEIEDIYWDDFIETSHMFVKIMGNYVPYFIEDIRETNHLLVKIEDIDNPEQASSLGLHEIYLREKDLTSQVYMRQREKWDLEGFTLCDKGEPVGIIETIENHPGQIMAVILYKNQKKHIPLADQLILDIDPESRMLNMDLPQGILEI